MSNFNFTEDVSVETLAEELKRTIRDVPGFPKPEVLFKDITPVLQNPKLCQKILRGFLKQHYGKGVNVVIGVESRGFLFGLMLAMLLDVPFVPVRKAGKLPHKTISYKYNLEYGSGEVEIHEDAIKPGDKALIHDDLLATGGTAYAAGQLVEQLGGIVEGFSFLIELSFLEGRQHLLAAYPTKEVSSFVSFD